MGTWQLLAPAISVQIINNYMQINKVDNTLISKLEFLLVGQWRLMGLVT